ncbi:MAG TPA: G1 family glutamic endopeptidase [Acidimicrobiales bacterium]|nr:G1 family glutamic endopeptidase [Acidimicrobiales bacterium]
MRRRLIIVPVALASLLGPLLGVPAAGASPGFPGIQRSLNWSGYSVPSNGWVHRVAGEWTVPVLDCDTPDAAVGEWVGIGGAGGNSGNLLQTGVSESCYDHHQFNQAWWELVPSGLGSVIFSDLVVLRGQHIAALVIREPDGRWATRVDDLSTGLSGTAVVGGGWSVVHDGSGKPVGPPQGRDSLGYAGGHSAEWIVEDPYSVTNAQLPLASFDTIAFGDLHAAIGYSWHLAPTDALEIAHKDGSVIAVPTLPAEDGFTVSYTGGWRHGARNQTPGVVSFGGEAGASH